MNPFKYGINILSGFKMNSNQPIDLRQLVDTIDERDDIVTNRLAYQGLRVFVKETKQSYIFNGEDWDAIPSLSGPLSNVAFSGDYNDLINKPNIPTVSKVGITGSYTDLLNLPTIPEIPSLATVATSGSYNDLKDKPTIPTIPELADVATSGSYNDLINKPNIPEYPSLATVATSGDYDDLTNKPTLSSVATSGSYTDLKDKPSLATVATSGSYNDLKDKPTIPTIPSSLPANGGTALTISQTLPITKGGTGATELGQAANMLKVLSLKPTVELVEEQNLDDVDIGTYNSIDASLSKTLINTPITGSGFMLIVFNVYGSNNNYRRQIATDYKGNTFHRYRNSDKYGQNGKVIIIFQWAVPLIKY